MSDDIMKELQSLQDSWEKAEEGGTTLPDGMYTFKIVSASVGKSQASGRLQLGMKLQVVVGEHTGKELMNYQGLDGEQSMSWLKRNMTKLEMQVPSNLMELPTWCRTLVGVTYQGQVKNKDGFCNVYPQRRVEVGSGGTSAGRPAMGM